MKCAEAKCENEAVQAIALNVPAVGHAEDPATAIRMVWGLCFCETCFVGLKAADFIVQDPKTGRTPIREIVEIQARGRAEPDFDRAFLTRVPFNSREWQILNKPKP